MKCSEASQTFLSITFPFSPSIPFHTNPTLNSNSFIRSTFTILWYHHHHGSDCFLLSSHHQFSQFMIIKGNDD